MCTLAVPTGKDARSRGVDREIDLRHFDEAPEEMFGLAERKMEENADRQVATFLEAWAGCSNQLESGVPPQTPRYEPENRCHY
jgi:hypothetical protein